MKRFFVVLMLLALAMLVSVSVVSAQGQVGRYVILMNGNGIARNFDRAVADAGGQIVRTIPQVGIVVAESSNADFLARISRNRAVADAGVVAVHSLPDTTTEGFAEVEAPTAADDLYNGGLVWGVNRVYAPTAWANGNTGSHDTVVAVIDTGIAWNHPDLAPNVVYVDCYTSAGSYAEGACFAYPFASDHGTHVAGTVAAAFGGGRVVGVGPTLGLAGYNTFEFIPTCGVCSYSDSRWIAMVDAADRGFAAINMSLGSTAAFGGQGTNGLAAFWAAEKRIANYVNSQGTVMVASAGNNGLDLNGTIVHFPGDIPGIVNVSATGIQPAPRYPFAGAYDILAFYSNYGGAVTIAAPGGDCGQIGVCNNSRPANWFEYLVLSTIVAPNPTCAATASCAVGYGWKGGTSMASPHVAGVAGLVADARPDLNSNQIVAVLKRSAEALGDRQLFGAGMVNAPAAIQAALEITD